VKVPLDPHIGVSKTGRRSGSGGAIDAQIRKVQIEFEAMLQPVVDLEIGRVLAQVWKLRRLQAIEFIEEFEV